MLLRHLSLEDAEFVLELLNDPAFIQNIGDRQVRNIADAKNYIETGPLASYREFGFGLFLVELKQTDQAMGICGLLKRKELDDVDVGFAFLPQFRTYGYAYESTAAVMNYGWQQLNLNRIVAITSMDNTASIRLLEKIGLQFEKTCILEGDNEPIRFFSAKKPEDVQ